MFLLRNKRLRGPSQSLSAVTAALESENEESDSDDDQQPVEEVVEEVQEDPENPQWQLFNSVRMYTNAQGEKIFVLFDENKCSQIS